MPSPKDPPAPDGLRRTRGLDSGSDYSVLVRSREGVICAARGSINPAAETLAAFERRQPVPQGLLASCATRGTALATRQRAHEPSWRAE